MIALPLSLGGKVGLFSRRGKHRRALNRQPNLLTDSGLDLIAASRNWLDCVQVGRSGLAPSTAHTGLLDPVAGTANRIVATSAAANEAPWRGFSRITWLFDVGAVTGEIREIGIGASATPGDPTVNRAIVRDALGAASRAFLLDDEALEVEFELSVYAPLDDVTGTIEVNGVEYVYVARAALASTTQQWAPYNAENVTSPGQAVQAVFDTTPGAQVQLYSGPIGSITSSPAGSSLNVNFVDSLPYVPGSRRRDARLGFDPTASAFDVRSMLIRFGAPAGSGGRSLGAYQIEFDPVIPRAGLQAEFLIDVGIQWGRQ